MNVDYYQGDRNGKGINCQQSRVTPGFCLQQRTEQQLFYGEHDFKRRNMGFPSAFQNKAQLELCHWGKFFKETFCFHLFLLRQKKWVKMMVSVSWNELNRENSLYIPGIGINSKRTDSCIDSLMQWIFSIFCEKCLG